MSWFAQSGAKALLRDYRRFAGGRLLTLLALMLSTALAEGFGIMMLVPLVAVATGMDSGGGGLLADLLGPLLAIPAQFRLAVVLALFVAAMAARSVLIFLRDTRIAALDSAYENDLRLRAASALARRGWAFAGGVGQAGMQALLLTDVPRSVHAVSHYLRCVTSLVMLAVQTALAALLSWPLALLAAGLVAAGHVAARGWTGRGMRSGLAMAASHEQSSAAGFRLHAGLKAALAQGTVAHFLGTYRDALARTRSELVRFARDHSAARTLTAFGSAIAAAVLLFFGIELLGLAIPLLIAALALFARMTGPALQLQQSLQALAAYAPSFAAIERRVGPLEPFAPAPSAARETIAWSAVELREVTYRHEGALGIAGVTMRLDAGEWLGLAGPSGAGKTTLVDLVAGLVAPQAGAILVDGQPLAGALLDRWRGSLAYVGQDEGAFDGSIRANLLPGTLDCADGDLWRALDLVGLTERVKALPEQLDAEAGDRGSRLSGGERQRLAIARAALRAPSLLILDEATAALDSDSEARLFAGLRRLDPRPALLVVAHRPSTLEQCDRVVTLAAGRVDADSARPTFRAD